ncbi:unnamed protein product [Calypogeia fissa]
MILSSSSNLIAAATSPPPLLPSTAFPRAPGRSNATSAAAAFLCVVPRLKSVGRRRRGYLGGLSQRCAWKMASLDGHGQQNQQPGEEATKIISKVAIAPSDDKLRTDLYPYIDANQTGFLEVSDIHTLYWEESGNPAGQPVIFLHGGPGAGTSGSNRRFFDPDHYRIILLDQATLSWRDLALLKEPFFSGFHLRHLLDWSCAEQRGAGKSTPHACTEENTTWDLVSDIEKLREHLGIEKWMVFGGSWGSTLSLTYAETHPERVTGIVLRGIFLLRKKEIDWFYQSGTSSIFPDAWEPYRDFIPEKERGDFLTAYSKRLNSSDRAVQLAAAKAWTNWEMATSYLVPNVESLRRGENDRFALAFARVENHYFMNKGFLPSDSYILDNISKIKHIPGVIVQGRYDVVCPMMSAWDLHKAWPEAKFQVVPTAGHSANEVGISAELVAATEYFKHNALSST